MPTTCAACRLRYAPYELTVECHGEVERVELTAKELAWHGCEMTLHIGEAFQKALDPAPVLCILDSAGLAARSALGAPGPGRPGKP